MKIYVASSWRNNYQPRVVEKLRELGHEVYDFRNPPNGSKGFAWASIDKNWLNWSTDEYRQALKHPLAEQGFNSDLDGMKWADCCIMVLPCGRSANTEAGWMKGNGKQVYVYQPESCEPELMYKIYDGIIAGLDELVKQFQYPIAQNLICIMNEKREREIVVEFEQSEHRNGLYFENSLSTEQRIKLGITSACIKRVMIKCETEEAAIKTANYYFPITGKNYKVISNTLKAK